MSSAQLLDWNEQPLHVLQRWPSDVPLAALLSGDNSSWSRISVIGVPREWKVLRAHPGLNASDVLAWIRSLDRTSATCTGQQQPPIGAGWFTQFSYELGGVLEPKARANQANSSARAGEWTRLDNTWPLAQAARCDRAFVFDHAKQQWWSIGGAVDSVPLLNHESTENFECDPLQEEISDAQYAQAVKRTIDLIHQGDLFQANIARRWHSSLRGCPRAFAHLALRSSAARYGAWLETSSGMLASMSPELFLELDAHGLVVSRPIKGTRASDTSSEKSSDELARSEKDAAELHMIVDLMRNDLSRACRPASVSVRQARVMETHGTVVHGVAEIHGQLQIGCDRAALLGHTFAPGSITGAPKIRAMQVIDELETFERGPYCGAIGYLADTGAMKLSVAIRTALLRESSPNTFALTYAAGCGITSDSNPNEEVAESHAKVQVLQAALRAAHQRGKICLA